MSEATARRFLLNAQIVFGSIVAEPEVSNRDMLARPLDDLIFGINRKLGKIEVPADQLGPFNDSAFDVHDALPSDLRRMRPYLGEDMGRFMGNIDELQTLLIPKQSNQTASHSAAS